MSVRIGMMKVLPERWGVEKNFELFEKYAKIAHEKGVQLLMTCEGFLDGYCPAPKNGNVFDPVKFENIVLQDKNSSKYINRVKEIAKQYKMHILFGYSERSDKGPRNAAIFIDEEGKEIGSYYKIMCFNHDSVFTPGDDLPVFDTKLGKFGVLICADRRWPEHIGVQKQKGAEAILIPTYGMNHLENEWWQRTHAYDNEIWILFGHPLHSIICDHKGNVQARMESNVDGVLVYDADFTPPIKKMSKPKFRRPDLYGPLAEVKDEEEENNG